MLLAAEGGVGVCCVEVEEWGGRCGLGVRGGDGRCGVDVEGVVVWRVCWAGVDV